MFLYKTGGSNACHGDGFQGIDGVMYTILRF